RRSRARAGIGVVGVALRRPEAARTAAAYRQLRAIDEARRFGKHENDRPDDFMQLAVAVERSARSLGFRRQPVPHVLRLLDRENAWADDVDADVRVLPIGLTSDAADKAFDAGLAGRRVGDARLAGNWIRAGQHNGHAA